MIIPVIRMYKLRVMIMLVIPMSKFIILLKYFRIRHLCREMRQVGRRHQNRIYKIDLLDKEDFVRNIMSDRFYKFKNIFHY